MPMNSFPNNGLIDRVLKSGNYKNRIQAVNAALNEYIKHQKRMRLLETAGTVDFRPGWDYKADRRLDLKRPVNH